MMVTQKLRRHVLAKLKAIYMSPAGPKLGPWCKAIETEKEVLRA